MTYEIEQKLTEIFPWVDSTQFDCDCKCQSNTIARYM